MPHYLQHDFWIAGKSKHGKSSQSLHVVIGLPTPHGASDSPAMMRRYGSARACKKRMHQEPRSADTYRPLLPGHISLSLPCRGRPSAMPAMSAAACCPPVHIAVSGPLSLTQDSRLCIGWGLHGARGSHLEMKRVESARGLQKSLDVFLISQHPDVAFGTHNRRTSILNPESSESKPSSSNRRGNIPSIIILFRGMLQGENSKNHTV